MTNPENANSQTYNGGPRRADPGKFHEDAHLSVEWLKKLGLARPSSRYDLYLNEIDRPEIELRSLDIDSNEAKKVACASHELIELIKIRKNLQDIDPCDYRDQLEKMASGQEFRNLTAKDQSLLKKSIKAALAA